MYSTKSVERLLDVLPPLEGLFSPLLTEEDYHTLPVGDVIQSAFSYIGTLPNEDEIFASMAECSAETIGQLAYVAGEAHFFGYQVAVFDNFPNIVPASQFVFKLTKRAYTARMTPEEYRRFVSVLAYVDEHRIEFKFDIPYRLLKLLIIMTLYKAYANTSVLARFILHQVALSAHVEI